LLVEDNTDHAELVIRSLGYARIDNVVHVTDGETALDYLLRRNAYADLAASPLPKLVLLDLRLPRVDGLQVLKTLKSVKTLAHIPIVVLTTSTAAIDIAQAYAYHANSYLVKPVGFEEFKQLMEVSASFWLRWNILPSV
jgi:CheY-like chemotaxis protein